MSDTYEAYRRAERRIRRRLNRRRFSLLRTGDEFWHNCPHGCPGGYVVLDYESRRGDTFFCLVGVEVWLAEFDAKAAKA
jgi:hypothetical protein